MMKRSELFEAAINAITDWAWSRDVVRDPERRTQAAEQDVREAWNAVLAALAALEGTARKRRHLHE